MRSRPNTVLVLHQLADRAHPAIAEMVDVVDLALPRQIDQRGITATCLPAQHPHGVGCVELEPHVIFTRPTAERS